jgi:hypothetical protein
VPIARFFRRDGPERVQRAGWSRAVSRSSDE